MISMGWLSVVMVQEFFIYFFADDSVLFCRVKEEECQKIIDLLSIYERG